MSSSSAPATVTVWGVSQFAAVNVNSIGDTVAAAVSPEDTSTLTSAVGRVASATVNVADPSSSTVTDVLSSTSPAESSSSTTVTCTPRAVRPS